MDSKKGETLVTEEEKNVLKQMNRMMTDLIYVKGVQEAVLKSKVENWMQEMDKANGSAGFQELRKRLEEAREAVDILIDKGDIVGAVGKIGGGYVN